MQVKFVFFLIYLSLSDANVNKASSRMPFVLHRMWKKYTEWYFL